MAKSKKTNCIPSNQKYTLQDLNIEFPDNDACLMFVLESRWPDGRTLCEKCGVERKHYRVTRRTALRLQPSATKNSGGSAVFITQALYLACGLRRGQDLRGSAAGEEENT